MEDDIKLDMTKCYIYEGDEYMLTGRSAQKQKTDVSNTSRRRNRSNRPTSSYEELMVEIKRAPSYKAGSNLFSPSTPGSSSTKWVKYSELYIVSSILDEN
tara:strand:- start:611 stop:910 length:300 start_codon:yes stop_codon:yes gene_type:complete